MLLSRKVKAIINSALVEDAVKQDITTISSIPSNCRIKAMIVAKEKGLLCGIQIAREVFKQLDKKIVFKDLKKDGSFFKKNQEIAIIEGKAKAILSAERVALNFLSYLSGVATLTQKFVNRVKETDVKIMDTRKTTPNLRFLEKYAVRIGGGYNHRNSLADGIIVKDNHLKAIRYIKRKKIDELKIKKLIVKLKKITRFKVEIEVENLNEFEQVIKYNPDIIMLDNFSLANVKRAVNFRNKYFPEVKLEASGGITLNNVKPISLAGVDFISVGQITHSPEALNFSLEIK